MHEEILKIKKVKLLDHEFDLVLEDPRDWSEGSIGRASVMSSRITMNPQVREDLLKSVIVHEVVHLIADLNGLNMSEDLVSALGLGVWSFIKNNPELISEMIRCQEIT